MKPRILFVQFVFVSTLLLILAGICSLSAAEEQESLAPPKHVYTKDQLNVIQKHGIPWQFNIVFEQDTKFRYETWYYGGNIKKKFGFVNGKQELVAAFRFPLSDDDRVVGFEPKNFTFGTIARHMRVMFGAPDKIFRMSVPGIKHESHTYARKGVAAGFTKRKIESVATMPPFKNSASGRPINTSMFLSEMSNDDFEVSSAGIQAPNSFAKFSAIEAAKALLLAGLLIAEAIELTGNPAAIKQVEFKWSDARVLISLAIDVPFTAKDLQQAISEFKNALKEAAGCKTSSPLSPSASNCDPGLDYVNNLGDIQSTMGKTVSRSEEFPFEIINFTHKTGSECGGSPIPLNISVDGRSLGKVAAGRSITTPLTRGSHTFQGCGAAPFGCPALDLNVPKFTTIYFFWVCGGAPGIPIGVVLMN